MKNLLMTCVFLAAISPLSAGADPAREEVMNPKVIMKEATTSSGGDFLIPLLLLAVVAAVVTASSDGSSSISE